VKPNINGFPHENPNTRIFQGLFCGVDLGMIYTAGIIAGWFGDTANQVAGGEWHHKPIRARTSVLRGATCGGVSCVEKLKRQKQKSRPRRPGTWRGLKKIFSGQYGLIVS